MADLKTEILPDNQAGIARATDLLTLGQLVAFPTETVYGLGADACNDTAVARIFAAKNRPHFNPLILHVESFDSAGSIAELGSAATILAKAFWPGPLTLVLPLNNATSISALVSCGLETVAIRVPEHRSARELLAKFGGPVAAPSANPSGKVSPTQAGHVSAGLDGRIAAVLDGGECSVGLESTIIGFDPEPVLLRPGGLPGEAIEQCLGHSLQVATDQLTPNAPGQFASHYATKAPLRLNAKEKRADETMLGFGPMDCDLNLSASADLIESAANLFRHLQAFDAKNVTKIAVAEIPDHGLGRAINDRLKRAAAPRD